MSVEPPIWRADMRRTFARSVGVREPPERPDPSRLIAAALWYAEHGWPVFPLQPMSKVPYPGTRGFLDATTEPRQIVRWWSHRPDSNVGLATGCGLDVIDFDGEAAHAAWLEVFAHATTWDECDDLYVLATVHTPRPGGLHLYIDSTGVGNRQEMLPGVDYRGLGGYVVAPPSHTPAGRYLFIDRLDPGLVAR